MTTHWGHWINGVHRVSGEAKPNLDPSDLDTPVGWADVGDATDAAAAVTAAHAAFPAWSQTSPQVRADLLDAVARRLFGERDALGELLSREEGKPRADGVGEVIRASHIFRYFAGEAMRMTGDRLASTRANVDIEVIREAVGVIALITPWNFPMAIPAWKMAPALAFGNTVVLKPAEATPACAWALVDILHACGAPPGVVNLVLGEGRVIGETLVGSDRVDAVSFTGSVATGRRIAARCAEQGKRVQCEMGGKNPLIVLADADLNRAVEAALNGAYFQTGQRCTASSRLVVEEATHDAFTARLIARMRTLVTGPALAEGVHIGPVIDDVQLAKNLSYLSIAADDGGNVVGGDTVTRATRGHFMRPALVLDTTNDMRINRDEVFGPVASVIRVRDYEEALSVANETPFGLSAGLCTTSLATARHFITNAQAGMVMVNLPTAGVDPHVPFGGRKASSFGPREQGAYARDFYTQVKTAYVG